MKTEDIIVVEDNSTMRLGIVESLKREGYSISEFDNGPDALAHFRQVQAAMAVIDLKMEPLNGIEVLKAIKDQHAATEINTNNTDTIR